MSTHAVMKRFGVCAAAALALAGCTTLKTGKTSVYQSESFDSETFSRTFLSKSSETCEAARRALLSQGYVIDRFSGEGVKGSKNFQPQPEVHVQLQISVVCAPGVQPTKESIAFVSALQDRYTLRKSNNSASLGVSAIGSVSLPVSSSDDSLVKVASETVPAGVFYERFFSLLDRFLAVQESAVEPVDPQTLDKSAQISTAPSPAASAPRTP